jgi:hypothetical protein
METGLLPARAGAARVTNVELFFDRSAADAAAVIAASSDPVSASSSGDACAERSEPGTPNPYTGTYSVPPRVAMATPAATSTSCSFTTLSLGILIHVAAQTVSLSVRPAWRRSLARIA